MLICFSLSDSSRFAAIDVYPFLFYSFRLKLKSLGFFSLWIVYTSLIENTAALFILISKCINLLLVTREIVAFSKHSER